MVNTNTGDGTCNDSKYGYIRKLDILFYMNASIYIFKIFALKQFVFLIFRYFNNYMREYKCINIHTLIIKNYEVYLFFINLNCCFNIALYKNCLLFIFYAITSKLLFFYLYWYLKHKNVVN